MARPFDSSCQEVRAVTRSERLLALLQLLRRSRRPVSARQLASELGVSDRTVYRDIDALRTSGAHIEGEAGVGFVMREGYLLPPLMFTGTEVDALMLGLAFAMERGDAPVRSAALDVAAKLRSMLPPPAAARLDTPALIVGPAGGAERDGTRWLSTLRRAMWEERKVWLRYRDKGGGTSERTVWPITIGFMQQVDVLAAWCELRHGFRHFRLDQIEAARLTPEHFTRPRSSFMGEWRALTAVEARW